MVFLFNSVAKGPDHGTNAAIDAGSLGFSQHLTIY